jgi:acyl-CoA thioester hydrolase
VIEVHTRATGLTGARLSAEQDIFCKGVQLTRGRVEACIITLDGRVRRIPSGTRDKLARFVSERIG